MKMTPEWITYRTRFLVRAKQLQHSLTFTDVLGRLHTGRKGDYMVESSDGVLSIAPRQIFEDVYVPMSAQPNESPTSLPVAAPPGRKSPTRVGTGRPGTGASFACPEPSSRVPPSAARRYATIGP